MTEHELTFVEADPGQAGLPGGDPHWSCVCGYWRWTLDPQGQPDQEGVTPYFEEHLAVSGPDGG